jgi:predicted RecA/RadA family phage recombinase
MKTYRAPGEVIEFTAPGGGVLSGTAYKIGSALVVATHDAAATAKFNGLIEGVVEVAKVSAQAWTEGQQINYDTATKLFTTVTTGNFRAGLAVAAAANPSATGLVKLNGVDVGAVLP